MRVWFTLVLALAAPFAALGQEPGRQIDPNAKGVLEAMVRAYRGIRSLQQETAYSGSVGAGGSIERARLIAQRPNRLLLELTQRTPLSARAVNRRTLCDGKNLYTYDDLRNQYTQEKAPRDFGGFQQFAISVEMAALVGADPFVMLEKQVRALRLEAPVTADAVLCDVVYMDIGDETRTGEARFFIGQADHLIRRFTMDSKTLPRPKQEKPTPQTPGWDDETPEDTAPPPPTHFEYENHVANEQVIPKDTFRWVAPPGAMRLNQSATAYLHQEHKGKSPYSNIATPMDLSNPTDPSDLSHPTKVITAKELIDRAMKQQKKR